MYTTEGGGGGGGGVEVEGEGGLAFCCVSLHAPGFLTTSYSVVLCKQGIQMCLEINFAARHVDLHVPHNPVPMHA